ncbi:MAG: hypothetical protein QXI77_03480 [Nanopusillaceae archaeon]
MIDAILPLMSFIFLLVSIAKKAMAPAIISLAFAILSYALSPSEFMMYFALIIIVFASIQVIRSSISGG